MHRLIRPDITGEIDHDDRNGLNNRRSNLRAASRAEQLRNLGIRVDNTSGYKGVSWSKDKDKWRARIMIDGKEKSLGYYDDPEEAARVRDAAAQELHGEFAFVHSAQTDWRRA
jgi:hypothetical protein